MNRAELCQTSVPLQAEPIKNKSCVLITCAVDHRTLFIRPTNPDENNEYIKILNDVIADAKKSEYLRKYPSLGSLVSAPFQKVYYRAMILKMINENEMVVGFIDFGNVEVCQFSEIKQLSVNLQRRKRFAKKVILRNVPEKCLNRDALLIINELIVNDMKLTIQFDDMQSNLCTLTPRNLTESLNSLIISKCKPSCLIKERDLFFGEVIFVYVICLSFQFLLFELNLKKNLLFQKISYKILEGSNIKVVVIDNALIFLSELNVVKVDDMETFFRNEEEIQEVGKAIFGYTLDKVYLPRYVKYY